MLKTVKPGDRVGRDGGSYQEISSSVLTKYGRYCTIRDNEIAPPTSKPGRIWMQIYRTPDNTE